MTTATTVIGLLPMLAFNLGGGRLEIWASLALCTAGGLVSSTVLVLFVVPIFYFYGCGLRLRLAGRPGRDKAIHLPPSARCGERPGGAGLWPTQTKEDT
jgi:HAE1 family hydrophobic/amphiphilic exporter-1